MLFNEFSGVSKYLTILLCAADFFLFVNARSLATFSSRFWYESIDLDEPYPTLTCASRSNVHMPR
jgi:hypothetical protein